MSHLIDTDIFVDYLRHIEAAANYLDSIADWSVSVVTGLELIAGAKDKREVAEIDLVLGAYHVVPTNAEIGQLAYNDVSTMTAFAYDRVRSGQRMPGIFETAQKEVLIGKVYRGYLACRRMQL